jgi:TetR/AcrR family transcriptional regulator, transcriptional repressor for nem operon
VAALAAEIAHQRKPIRSILDQFVRDNIAAISRFLPGETASEKERTAIALFSGMSGALSLARATSDEELRRKILESSRSFYVQALCQPS